jgi:hypothetical protein
LVEKIFSMWCQRQAQIVVLAVMVICVSNYRLCKPSSALPVEGVESENGFCIPGVPYYEVAVSMAFEEKSGACQIAYDPVRKVFRASQEEEENVGDRKENHHGLALKVEWEVYPHMEIVNASSAETLDAHSALERIVAEEIGA